MSKENVSVSSLFKVWNDDDGVSIEVGEDLDGLGLIEIRTVDDDSKTWFGDFRVPLSLPMAKGVVKALQEMIRQIENKENQ